MFVANDVTETFTVTDAGCLTTPVAYDAYPIGRGVA